MKRIIAGLVIAASFVTPMVANQAAAQAVTPWRTVATVRSTDAYWAAAHAGVVRNPYNFRVWSRPPRARRSEVEWCVHAAKTPSGAELYRDRGSELLGDEDICYRPSNPGDYC